MHPQKVRVTRIVTAGLLIAAELVVYVLILTPYGPGTLDEFSVALFAFIYALTNVKKDPVIAAALLFTVVSDVFLILVKPQLQGLAMTTFSVTQLLYAYRLHKGIASEKAKKITLAVRGALCLSGLCLAVTVLRERVDYVSLISVFYFANLLTNTGVAFSQFGRSPLTALGLLLFIGCDIFIGLKCAAGVYLAVDSVPWLERLVFSNFNFAYFFYVPSQTLLALSSNKKE